MRLVDAISGASLTNRLLGGFWHRHCPSASWSGTASWGFAKGAKRLKQTRKRFCQWVSLFPPCVLVTSAALLAACAHQPPYVEGLRGAYLSGAKFQHLTYGSATADDCCDHQTLHLYIDGDGRPWIERTQVAADPSPPPGLVLELVRRDGSNARYLGRPCHHTAFDTACDANDWTFGRYSDAVVTSMIVAARALNSAGRPLLLIGFSGGGTLAVLMAERMPEVRGVVTLAANLDVAAWAAHHRYLPLIDSLDPAHLPPLRTDLRQLHLQGALDREVPTQTTDRFFTQQVSAERRTIAHFHHDCCWMKIWPQVLTEIDQW